MKKIVEVKSLTKKFPTSPRLRRVRSYFTAVDNISFEINEGEIVGLLGPNGAGKTTTIMTLLGLIKPTTGKIKIFGLDFEKHRQEILQKTSFASSELKMQGRLTVWDNLYIYSLIYGLENRKEKIKSVLKDLEITDLAKKRFTYLSAGQRTKAILAKALLPRPRLIILDEPTASLDPYMAMKVQDLLLHIKKKFKVTMLYTSHNMAEINKMCDRVIFLNRGKIIAQGTPLELTKKVKDSDLINQPDLEEVFIELTK